MRWNLPCKRYYEECDYLTSSQKQKVSRYSYSFQYKQTQNPTKGDNFWKVIKAP